MKAFYDFLEQHNLSFDELKGRLEIGTDFYIRKKNTNERDSIAFRIMLQKDWHIELEKPILHLRMMLEEENYFSNKEDEQKFFKLLFFFFQDFVNKSFSYSYVFMDKDFIQDLDLQKQYKITQEWKDSLLYPCSYQFCSPEPSLEIEVYRHIRNFLNKLIQEETKKDPRIYVKYLQNTGIGIYMPNCPMDIKFSFEDSSLKLTVKRSRKRDKVTIIPLENKEEALSLISDWWFQLYRENQLSHSRNKSKKIVFHQTEYAKNIQSFSLSPLFDWLEQHHTNEEIEKMTALERRKKGDLFIESTLLTDSYYLVPFQQYHFMFEKNGLVDVFIGLNDEKAVTCFYEKITTLFHENMKKEQQTIKTR